MFTELQILFLHFKIYKFLVILDINSNESHSFSITICYGNWAVGWKYKVAGTIRFLSVVCKLNGRRSRYHPAVWSARRWSCCDAERRSALGCALADVWPLPEFELDQVSLPEEHRITSELPRKWHCICLGIVCNTYIDLQPLFYYLC